MPSKATLMAMGSAQAIVAYAVSNHGVDPVLRQVATLEDGSRSVILLDSGQSEFTGVGASTKEAVADAVSTKFPG